MIKITFWVTAEGSNTKLEFPIENVEKTLWNSFNTGQKVDFVRRKILERISIGFKEVS